MKEKYLFIFLLSLIIHLFCFPILAMEEDHPDLKRFSSIVIKSYTPPDDATIAAPSGSSPLPPGIAPYKEEHGRGRFFDYKLPPENELGNEKTPGTHKYILAQLNKYKEVEFSKGDDQKRNLLLVRMKLSLKGAADTASSSEVEYWFGVFVSGNDDFSKGTLDSLLKKVSLGFQETGSDLPEVVVAKIKNSRLQMAQSLFMPELQEYMEYPPSGAPADLELKVLKKKLIKLSPAITLPPRSTFDYLSMKPNDLLRAVRQKTDKRLFGESSVEVAPSYAEYSRRLNLREQISHDLFGMPYYNKTGYKNSSCYDDADKCFVQSEPCFLAFLEKDAGRDKECFKAGDLVANGDYDATIDLFSYKDICIMCRGTFSYMIHTRGLHETIRNYLNKTQAADSSIGNIQDATVYAHSILQTDF